MTASAKYFQPEVLSRISSLELRARRVVEGFVSGMHKSPYRGFSVEFATHRQYAPGDDIRHLDWRVYAKADRFFIKEYEVETNMRTHLLVDCSASMAYPEHPRSDRMTKWDYAATVAASLAQLLLGQQDGVGMALFDAGMRKQFPVSTNRASCLQFIRALEQEKPGDRTDAGTMFAEIARKVPRRGMIVLISDLLFDVQTLIDGLNRMKFDQHDVLVLHVLDDDELTFPFEDRTLFEGMEDPDVEILTDPQSLRDAYLASLQSYLSSVRSACLDRSIDYAMLNTGARMDVALTRFLASRMGREHARA